MIRGGGECNSVMMDDREAKRRVEAAVACRDADSIPKVPNAGQVRVDEAGNRVQVMHNGLLVLADGYYGSFTTQIIERLRGHHEPQEEKVFHEVLKVVPPGSAMLELGAYWAYYSLWFQHVIQGARNFMIEPQRDALECGMRNFQLNGMRGSFTQAFVGRVSSHEWQKARVQGGSDPVGQVCVKDFVQSKGLDSVGLLHADIQGSEYEMLCGCGDLLDQKKIGFVFLSSHSLKLHYQCLRYLAQNGYSIIAEHTPKESYSEDGLIAASATPDALPAIRVSRKPVSLRLKWKTSLFKVLYGP